MEARSELQAAFSDALERMASENEALKFAHAEELSALKEENHLLKEEVRKLSVEVKDELVLLKRLVAQGNGTSFTLTNPTARVDVPKPNVFKGSRNAREIDNFLWALEQYFRALGVEEDSRKVDNAPLFLAESAMVWWRRRMMDMEKGTCNVRTWDEFKKELKKQFYPEHAADEARAKLRRLTQRGTIREYVKEFSEVLLEVPEYPDQELLFFFKDGLQAWARLEIERRGAQDLAAAITIAESLVEYKKGDKPKAKDGKSKHGGDKSGGKDSHREGPKEGNAKKPWVGKKDYRDGKFKKNDKFHKPIERGPLKCFLCDGPHRARECPKNAALDALVADKEDVQPRQEGSSMGSMQLAAVNKGKQVEVQVANKGRLFAQLKFGQNEIQALVDTGASDNFLRLEEAQKFGIAFHKQAGWLKAVNSKPTPTHGVASKVAVKLGEWTGFLDFSIVSMDDYACVLGMDFMDRVRAIPIPFANSLCIVENGGACMVPLKRGKNGGSTLSALQLAKGVKKREPTFLVALQAEGDVHAMEIPHEVVQVKPNLSACGMLAECMGDRDVGLLHGNGHGPIWAHYEDPRH
ncbi:hypothetical protein GH714_027351 [Hevea brasiliensis]|uniref:Retrotransposon gag domain-containing protein n=1 Tax=Hevea brasiliensis TaxID=3981 RepID=A0A6A6M8Y6_HEVBR|nr:hypothetical protein GH714_027351 [Hevea brasiliensis]